MAEWKAAGRAQKDADDTLWQRFRGAQDAFFARRNASFSERDAEFVANAEAKKALLAEAEKIDTADPAAARAALRAIHERWEEIGKVPREEIRPLEARLRAVEDRVRESAEQAVAAHRPRGRGPGGPVPGPGGPVRGPGGQGPGGRRPRRAEQAQQQADQWREWLTTAEQAVHHR